MSVLGLRKWNDTIVTEFDNSLPATINGEEGFEVFSHIFHFITNTSFEAEFEGQKITITISKVIGGVTQDFLSDISDVICYYIEIPNLGSMWFPVYYNNTWNLNIDGIELPKTINYTGVYNGTSSMGIDYYNTWLLTNTEAVVEEKPLAEITYNGETIAQLNAGETATLSCEGKKMVSDVVVKVNEVESKIPDGYIKPEGSLSITENGTYPVTDKEEVVVEVPIPKIIEAPNEITVNGTYTASMMGADGISKVIVNVEGGEATLTTKEITENGTYNPSDDGADGYSSVTVKVATDATATSETVLAPYTFYANGTKSTGTIPTYDGAFTGGVELEGVGVPIECWEEQALTYLASQAKDGTIFKYMWGTSGTYETKGLYIVEEVSE